MSDAVLARPARRPASQQRPGRAKAEGRRALDRSPSDPSSVASGRAVKDLNAESNDSGQRSTLAPAASRRGPVDATAEQSIADAELDLTSKTDSEDAARERLDQIKIENKNTETEGSSCIPPEDLSAQSRSSTGSRRPSTSSSSSKEPDRADQASSRPTPTTGPTPTAADQAMAAAPVAVGLRSSALCCCWSCAAAGSATPTSCPAG